MYEMNPAYSVTAINTNVKASMGKELVNFIICGCELSAPFLAHQRQAR
jgi:hypothetical protein